MIDYAKYVYPEDPLIRERLEVFRDWKLALMLHWGPYSQLGIVESWALSDEDAEWSRRQVDWRVDGETFKEQYRGLAGTFNPVRFLPEQWADLASENCFKYMIFTAKHHDGFCMWDTKLTDYKITSDACPYHASRNADVCAGLFEAFRKKGMGVVAYFSKADWNVPSYWAPGMLKGNFMNRGPSYEPSSYPELWDEFVRFTHRQVLELLQNYGRIDGLWFDAGWVCKENGQDIRIEELVHNARKIQPWVLSVNRANGGICENYLTPEQTVPAEASDIPWESCVTMGTSFSFAYEDSYKTVRELVHLLIDIVAKGGNLALNVGPQPDGRLPRTAIERMRGMGEWLRVYGEAIFETRICAPYRVAEFAFTRKAKSAYAFRLYSKSEPPASGMTLIPFYEKISSLTDLSTGEELSFAQDMRGVHVSMPERRSIMIADVWKMEFDLIKS